MRISSQSESFEQALKHHQFHPVILPEWQFGKALIVDLSPNSDIWQRVNEQHDFSAEIKRQVAETGAVVEIAATLSNV